jgi:septal ring factor EnvC (AmiA/AmiB activator)|tara:strand:- start:1609 stop:1782 length:174 start_codon:yes stop_codon:yes gene_type:complete
METSKITDEITKQENELKESMEMRKKLIDQLNRLDKVIHGHMGAIKTLNNIIDREMG